ncbi:MAG: tetratricopeptide repeat protein [Armatimonadota bacterium]
MMRRPGFGNMPPVPDPGPQTVVSGRATVRLWVGVAITVAIIAALWVPLDIESHLTQMRQQFVALRYIQKASQAAIAPPVQRKKIIGMADRALAANPDDAMIRRRAATTYMSVRAYDEAIEILRGLPNRGLIMDSYLGHCLLASGELEAGEKVMQSVLSRAKLQRRKGTMAPSTYAVLLNSVGYGYSVGGIRLNDARSLLREALGIQPLQPAFIDSLGWIYYSLGDFHEALFYLERAVRLMGPQENAEIYYHLGAAYARMGRVRKAKRALQNCLRLEPDFEKARDELEVLGLKLPNPPCVWNAASKNS